MNSDSLLTGKVKYHKIRSQFAWLSWINQTSDGFGNDSQKNRLRGVPACLVVFRWLWVDLG